MCSIPGDEPGRDGQGGGGELTRLGRLARLGRAIDELADAAAAQDPMVPEAAVPDLAARLARVWQMVAELDPELARRLAGYGR
jgi:hypothetical protein